MSLILRDPKERQQLLELYESWMRQNRMLYVTSICAIGCILSVCMIPLDFIWFPNAPIDSMGGNFTIYRLGTIAFGALVIGFAHIVNQIDGVIKQRILTGTLFGACFAFVLLYMHFFSISKAHIRQTVVVGNLITDFFTVFFLHRFWREQQALSLISILLFIGLIQVRPDLTNDAVTIIILHVATALLCMFLRREFVANMFDRYRNLRLLVPETMAWQLATARSVTDLDAIVQRRREEELAAQRDRAIAQTVQMLAHDVRRPFTLLRSALSVIQARSNDPTTLKSYAARLQGHVGKALEQVNGLLADVMEVSSTATALVCESEHPGQLLETAISQVYRFHGEHDHAFSYRLEATRSLHVDRTKVLRLLTNLIDNARQATPRGGRLWFESRDLTENGTDYVALTFGNSGSYILPEDRERIFQAFYTKGKRGGTGLGLAIAEKVVASHRGRIYCESSPDDGTRFICVLPAAQERASASEVMLPVSSRSVAQAFAQELRDDATSKVSEKELLNRKTLTELLRTDRRIKVAILEDDIVYSEALQQIVDSDELLRAHIDLVLHSNAEEFLEQDLAPFSLLICDIDLEHSPLSGLDVVQRLRSRSFRAAICIHSNRSLPDDYRAALDAGADALIPKPMSVAHLMDLLVKAVTARERG